MYLFYFLLAVLLVYGAKIFPKGAWNGEYTSLGQMKALQGACVLCISLHHMAQKTCAPWNDPRYIVHGMDFFVPIGFMLCAVFLFCSSYGLYKSVKTKPDYLRHFVRKRIVPLAVAYYLSEIIYLLVRAAMGEHMNAVTVLWYLSGLHMANFNTWYIIAILFFYFVFYLAFRFCKKDGTAIFAVFAVTLLYTVLCTLIDHQSDWFIRGEWWYNSILLFPVGLLFAKYEDRITAFFKKGYPVWLLFSFAGLIASFRFSVYLKDTRFGYYGETWGDPLKIWHRLGTCAGEWLACLFFVAFIFILLMKVRLGNRALAWLGSVTLEYYLMHGIFVELFGFDFLNMLRSIVYIKKVPLYIVTVLACAVAATLLFRLLLKGVMKARVFRIPPDTAAQTDRQTAE